MPKDRTRTPDAALGQPSPEHTDSCGQLQVPYLNWSYREMRQLQAIPTDPEQQQHFFFGLLLRRLPALTRDEFDERCGPADISAWFDAMNGTGGGEGNA